MKPNHPTMQQIPSLRQLWKEAFGDSDDFLDGFFATAFDPAHCLCMAEGEHVLSVAYWLDAAIPEGKCAYIYAVATEKHSRGMGYAHCIMEAVRDTLAQRGYCAAMLVPGDAGLGDFYAAMGYRFFGGVDQICALAKSPGVALQSIDADTYGRLRGTYLPQGAVIQAGASLRFLETYARLYAGEDFLLAAFVEGDTVSGLELLGNGEKAPYILQTLGAKQGSFRIPGTKPFAMWLPLRDCQEPTYFGIAFD
jgi:GNAT superfamily N-acetyltransferase